MLRNILLGVGLFATLLSILIFSGKIQIGSTKDEPKGTVTIWGTIPDASMADIILDYNNSVDKYTVSYRYVSEANFNQALLEDLASGGGPDLILTPYQTILSQSARIQAFPVLEKTFKDSYVDGASVLFSSNSTLALPVTIEPMVLFYNRTLLSKHGIANPPTYWDELTTMTPAHTLRQNGIFEESAIALGAPNIPYAKEIIMAIVMQLGQSPIVKLYQGAQPYYSVQVNEPVTQGGEILPLATVNRFFTQFADPGQSTYTWSQSEVPATDKFVAEKLAMYVGYSGELNTLRARNPRAEFEMTYLPQTKGYNTFSTGMRMYAIATLRSSRNMITAFEVQSQFSGPVISPRIAGAVGAVPALRSYANSQGLSPVIARSMLVARGWYDSYQKDTDAYAMSMISDIINYRYGVTDASNLFVSRLRDLYSRKF